MKRDPNTNMIFFGCEVERTAAHGQFTMFCAGYRPVASLLEQLRRAPQKVGQIYLAANQSYQVLFDACGGGLTDLITYIKQVLTRTPLLVAIDVPAHEAESFCAGLAALTYALRRRLIVQISVVVPHYMNAEYLYVKIDERVEDDKKSPGPLVIDMHTHGQLTRWSEYAGDTTTKGTQVDDPDDEPPPKRKQGRLTPAQRNAMLDDPDDMGLTVRAEQFVRSVTVHFMKRGVHCYPEAATSPALATGDKYDVSYLAHPHAHDFWFKVTVDVTHNDRDIEFIQLRLRLEDLYDQGVLDCGRKSCETMAQELIGKILEQYGDRRIEVSIYEDSLHANGGTVTYNPKKD